MSNPLQPIYLFADSQLLFWKRNGKLFLNSARELLVQGAPKAAYIGASNGDSPEFYQIFEAAMGGLGIQNCRMILSSFAPQDRSFVEEADLILLAGGDVERGWTSFQAVGLKELLIKKYRTGAILMGISAGAVQLGSVGWKAAGPSSDTLFDTLNLVPFIIGAHEEKEEWGTLKKVISLKNGQAKGIGIPTGGGMIYHANQTIAPIRHPLYECSLTGGRLRHGWLFPEKE